MWGGLGKKVFKKSVALSPSSQASLSPVFSGGMLGLVYRAAFHSRFPLLAPSRKSL